MFHWDDKELPQGYDHDGEARKWKSVKSVEAAPAGGDAGMPVLGKCTVCHRDAVHKWPDGTLICPKHWTRQLARRAQDMAEHPEWYKEEEAAGKKHGSKSAQGPASKRRRGKPEYGAKGNTNWERRANQ